MNDWKSPMKLLSVERVKVIGNYQWMEIHCILSWNYKLLVVLSTSWVSHLKVEIWSISIYFSNVDESPFGPLTQRLVSALIEENIMTPMDETMTDLGGGKDDQGMILSKVYRM